MRYINRHMLWRTFGCCGLGLAAGCLTTAHTVPVESPPPIGAVVDTFWQAQETNGESNDFVVTQNEFVGATAQLSPAGQDHLKQIARRLGETPFPVLVEPSSRRPFDDREFTEQEFTDFNREKREIMELDRTRRWVVDADRRAELDAARRQEVVMFLNALGYPYANERVFTGHPYSPGQSAIEAVSDYQRTLQQNFGGFGGGFGGGAGGGTR